MAAVVDAKPADVYRKEDPDEQRMAETQPNNCRNVKYHTDTQILGRKLAPEAAVVGYGGRYSAGGLGSKWNKLSNNKGGLPVGRAAYKIHIANLRVAKKIRKETDVLIPE